MKILDFGLAKLLVERAVAGDAPSATGEGGMGVVYRALDTKLNRQVAIKVLPLECLYNGERRPKRGD